MRIEWMFTWSLAPTSLISRVTRPKSWVAWILDPDDKGSPLWYQAIFRPVSDLGSTLHSRCNLQSSPTLTSAGRVTVNIGFMPGADTSGSSAGASLMEASVSAFLMLSRPDCPLGCWVAEMIPDSGRTFNVPDDEDWPKKINKFLVNITSTQVFLFHCCCQCIKLGMDVLKVKFECLSKSVIYIRNRPYRSRQSKIFIFSYFCKREILCICYISLLVCMHI